MWYLATGNCFGKHVTIDVFKRILNKKLLFAYRSSDIIVAAHMLG